MTERKIQDYLGFYTGCEIMINPHDTDKRRAVFIGFTGVDRLSAFVKYRSGPDGRINMLFIKPILRPLSDMTEEEKKEIGFEAFHMLRNDLGDRTLPARNLSCMWAARQTAYLLKQGFDLFNLIPDGLAIDKTTLKR